MVGTAVAYPAQSAHACSYTLELRRPQPLPEGGELTDVPANRVFVTPTGSTPEEFWGDWGDGEAPQFVVDEPLDSRFDLGKEAYDDFDYETVHRLVDPEAFVGREVTLPSCATDLEECRFTLGPIDDRAPAAPQVSDLEVELYASHGGGGISCPNIESMTMDVEVEDDRSGQQQLRLAAYIADDEATLATQTEPAVVWQPWSEFSPPSEVYIALGEGGDHLRSGLHFRRSGRYCFALTAIDMAGNESERSSPECIDTTDESDPRVNLASGCGCTTGAAGWRGWPWMFAPLVLGWRRRRRRR